MNSDGPPTYAQEEAFLQAIADNPGDDVTKMVYGDWLEEQPGRADDAHLWHWLGKRGLRPFERKHYRYLDRPGRKVPGKYSWAWYPSGAGVRDLGQAPPPHARLPRLVFLALCSSTSYGHAFYPSEAKALEVLKQALTRLKADWEP